jgi:alpha-L-arabinofuranosidase
MVSIKQLFSILAFAALLATAATAQSVTATIDATQTGQPITRLIFGGFMEPATTGVWSEMLSDRKFFNAITSNPAPATGRGGFGMRGPARRWAPVGGDSVVTMDKKDSYVGEWTPLVQLDATPPRGISQTGIALVGGRAYSGRVVLAGSPGVKVSVSLIWGPEPADRETVTIDKITTAYAKFPFKFTPKVDSSEGRLEIVGTGSGSFHIGAASLMPADNVSGFKAATIKYLKEMGISIARWPGGNFVSAYDWRDGIGDADKRPARRELAWNGMESNDMGIDDFMTFCRLLGAEPYIAINSGFGDAYSAGEEVEYVNGAATTRLGAIRAANGHPEPYGVKIWGVGNEMYGPWQWGHIQITQYPEKHNLIVKAMRKADPTVKIIASGATPEETSWCYVETRQFGTGSGPMPNDGTPLPFPIGSKQDWTGALLKTSADYIDYLGEHFYAYPNLYVDLATEKFANSDEPLELKARRLSNRVQFKFEAWDEYVKAMPNLKSKDIKFSFDEWSPRNRAVGDGPAPVSNPMLNSLTNVLTYHEFFRHSDKVGLAVATGGMGGLANDSHGDAAGFRTEGLVTKVLHDHFAGALPVAVKGNSPQKPIKGVAGIDTSAKPSGSPTFPLDVFAALSADRKTLTVSVVNPTEAEQQCDLNLTGVQAAGAAKLWQITAPAATGAAPAGAGRGGRGGFSGSPATMAEKSLPEAPGKVTLPPASISVYEFPVK